MAIRTIVEFCQEELDKVERIRRALVFRKKKLETLLETMNPEEKAAFMDQSPAAEPKMERELRTAVESGLPEGSEYEVEPE